MPADKERKTDAAWATWLHDVTNALRLNPQNLHDGHVTSRLIWFGRHPELCPAFEHHTPGPIGYTEWFQWAAQMERTHRQIECPGCGLYAIWVPRSENEPFVDEEFSEYDR